MAPSRDLSRAIDWAILLTPLRPLHATANADHYRPRPLRLEGACVRCHPQKTGMPIRQPRRPSKSHSAALLVLCLPPWYAIGRHIQRGRLSHVGLGYLGALIRGLIHSGPEESPLLWPLDSLFRSHTSAHTSPSALPPFRPAPIALNWATAEPHTQVET